MSTSNTLLIGSGRLARHLKHLSVENSLNSSVENSHYHYWDRSQSVQSLSPIIKSVTHIWLAISDQSIVPFYEQHLANKTKSKR